MSDPVKITFDSTCGSGLKIAGFFNDSSAPVIKGVVQICHGMSEYYGRYDQMAERFNAAGYHVCGIDMMGHGETYFANEDKGYPKGYFGEGRDSWKNILKDIMHMHEEAVRRYGKDVKYILYGHSMGSFVVRSIYSLPEYSGEFDGFVFASTMGPNPAVGVAKFLAGAGCALGSDRKVNKLLTTLAFGSYLKRIPNPKTDNDWISTDDSEVEVYRTDPMLGFKFTSGGFRALFNIVGFIQSSRAMNDLSGRPCFFTYGSEDPVGNYGKGVEQVIARMKQHGVEPKSKNYGPYRHEIQRESVREEYFSDLVEFFDGVSRA